MFYTRKNTDAFLNLTKNYFRLFLRGYEIIN